MLVKGVIIMRKYEAPCGYCEHFLTRTIEGDMSIYSKGLCDLKNEYVSLYGEICEQFVLRSGLYTTKSYPQNNSQ